MEKMRNKRFYEILWEEYDYSQIGDSNNKRRSPMDVGDIVDLLNDYDEEIARYHKAENKIKERILALEKKLDDHYNDTTPHSSVFHNPMSGEYAKEYREEIKTLQWVLNLLKKGKNKKVRGFPDMKMNNFLY